MYPDYRHQRQLNIPPVLIIGFLFFGIPAIIILPVMLADEYIKLPETAEALYYDPTQEHENSQQATENASKINRDWLTPYPSGYLLTPENLSAVLSGTPAKITPKPDSNNNAISIIETPNPTYTKTPLPTLTPTPQPTATITPNPIYETSTASVEQAKVTIAIGLAIKEEQNKINFNNWKRAFAKFIATIFATGLVMIVGLRIWKEYRLYKTAMNNQKRLEEIKASPWLAYPESMRHEAKSVYKLILGIVTYCENHEPVIDPFQQIKIPRYNKIPGYDKKSNEWTEVTNYLVNRGYIMKSQGKPTLFKGQLSVGHMCLIIEQGLYGERNPYEKLVAQSPSENEN